MSSKFFSGPLSAETVSGQVSSTATLPCLLKEQSESPYIRWSTDKVDVFERSGKESFQGEGYLHRVDVPLNKLLKGDCSLVLQNLTIADKGVYKSYQAVRRTKRSTLVTEKWLLINSVKLDGKWVSPNTRHTDTRKQEYVESY